MPSINSEWLLDQLKASAHEADQSLLAIFELLSAMPEPAPLLENSEIARSALLAYLTQQAKEANSQAPELLAQQLYHMANNAYFQQQINPSSHALYHAKQAAFALIKAQHKLNRWQTIQQYFDIKSVQYGLAAGLLVLTVTSILLSYELTHPASPLMAVAEAGTPDKSQTTPSTGMASPADTAEMYAIIEKMRDGRCHYIEALQLPTSQQGIYLQNVIAGQISSSVIDQKTARELISKVSCDYTPMLMRNSRG